MSTVQLNIRLPHATVALIDRVAARLTVERSGTLVTRSDVIREALTRSLIDAPETQPRKKATP